MRESKGESTLLRKRGAPVHEPGTRPQPFRPHVHVLVFRAYLLTEMPRSYGYFQLSVPNLLPHPHQLLLHHDKQTFPPRLVHPLRMVSFYPNILIHADPDPIKGVTYALTFTWP